MGKIRNEYIRGTAHVGHFGEKVREMKRGTNRAHGQSMIWIGQWWRNDVFSSAIF